MSWSGPPGQPGPSGPDGLYNPPAVGIPSPQSVEKIEVIKLQWEYIQGGQLMSRVEIWLDNKEVSRPAAPEDDPAKQTRPAGRLD